MGVGGGKPARSEMYVHTSSYMGPGSNDGIPSCLSLCAIPCRLLTYHIWCINTNGVLWLIIATVISYWKIHQYKTVTMTLTLCKNELARPDFWTWSYTVTHCSCTRLARPAAPYSNLNLKYKTESSGREYSIDVNFTMRNQIKVTWQLRSIGVTSDKWQAQWQRWVWSCCSF